MKKLLLLALLVLSVPGMVTAQENPIRISPGNIMYTAQPGSTVRSPITLQNTTNKPITVTVVPRDFMASDAMDGQPRLLLDNQTSPYGLSNWLTDANLDKRITVPANQTVEYEAIFRVPFGLTPKTYFGSVTFRPDSGAIVGSLVFITIGNPKTKLTIDSLVFGESDDAAKPHGMFTVIIHNSSEGISTPNSTLRITDDQGATVVELKQDGEGSILPSSRRKYTFTPASELPNKLLTASLTTVDQNGTTADKSIQLDREIAETEPEIRAVTDKTINPVLIGIIAAVLLGFVATVLSVIKRKRKTDISPLPAPDLNTETVEDPNKKYTNQD